MAQTKQGAAKIAASKAGCTLEEYQSRCASGMKWCYKCRQWKLRAAFSKDASRFDGLTPVCKLCRNGPGTASEKISKALKGRVSTFKGHKHTAEAKRRMSESHKGLQKPWSRRKRTDAEKQHLRDIMPSIVARGPDHYAYSHGRAQRNQDGRRDARYRVWRDAVFVRDEYTCTSCGDKRGGNLRAHHIKPFAKHPELRYDVSNGITLCHQCHELQHFKPESIRNQRRLKRGEPLWI